MMILALILALLAPAPATKPVAPKGPPGVRVALTDGPMFFPEALPAGLAKVDLVIHLHGAAWAAETQLVASGEKAALVTVVLPGLSDAYTKKFKDPAVFARILDEATSQLKARNAVPGRITLTSFSAGFGGVREILSDEKLAGRIDRLILCDSLHTGLTDKTKRTLDAKPLVPFVAFAKLAAEGKKTMLITHSQIQPPYGSTTETADFILTSLKASRTPAKKDWGGLTQLTLASVGRLTVIGFEGETGPDHMKHLHNLGKFIAAVPLP